MCLSQYSVDSVKHCVYHPGLHDTDPCIEDVSKSTSCTNEFVYYLKKRLAWTMIHSSF